MINNSTVTWAGRWGWISYVSDSELDVDQSRFVRLTGFIEPEVFGLPSDFIVALEKSGVLDRINSSVGSLLDIFEDEDISGKQNLTHVAFEVRRTNWPSEYDALVADLLRFLEIAANSDATLNFWL